MLENFLVGMGISKEELLKKAEQIKLNQKEREALNKGKEFVDKQMELPNDVIRQKVAVVLLAYIANKYDNN